VLCRALGQAVREGIVARNVAGLSAAPRIRAKELGALQRLFQLADLAAGRGAGQPGQHLPWGCVPRRSGGP
jgi:hypothetical protein